MKKLLYSAAAMVLAFFAASCQQENIEPVAGGNTVTYTVQVPESVQTKALGDEVATVDQVYYQVYRAAEVADLEKTFVYDGYAEVNAGQASFELEFIKNQEFVVLFWAQNSALQMFDLDDLRAVELETPGDSNNADAQVFAGKDEVEDCVSAVGGNVELVRPISQLNIYTTKESLTWGTGIALKQSYVKVSGLYKAYNVAEAAAVLTTETATFEYALANVPATAADDQYAYVAMNYVGFAANAGTNVTVDFTIKTSEGDVPHTVANVPVKPNYRTNIVGNLLTAETEYNVTINDAWYTPSEVVEIWDGQTLTTPDYNVENKTWTVDNGAELAWIAHLVNGTLPADAPTTRSGDSTPKYDKSQVIVLSKDINLGGYEWTPIGTGSKHFQGLFEGNGHVISNFQITEKHNGSQAAFFGTVSGDPTFRNVTIQNAKVVYPGEEAGDFYAAALIGTAYGNVTVQNVTVKNCEISGNNKVAGLLAHDGVMSSLNIDNCHVLNCEIVSAHATDGGNVGGLVGLFQGVAKTATNAAPYGDHIIKNSSVKNTVINAVNSTNSGKRSNGEFVACIGGKDNQTLVINNCVVEGNTFTQNEGVTYVSPYGVFVGGDRSDDRKATVIVDGKMMIDNGFTKEGNTFEVSNAAHFLAAANMLADGDVIKLLADVIFNANDRTNNNGWWDGLAYSGDKSFTIDLGGYTIKQDGSLNDYLIWVKNDGAKANTITLKNGTMDAGKTAYSAFATAASNTQKITVNLENINLINNISNGAVVKARGGSVLNVNAGTVITGKNSYVGIEAVGNNTVVNVYDGAKIYQNGTSSDVGAIIGASYNATLNIYGGEGKSAKCGIIVMSTGARVNVSGGEWIANGNGTVASGNNAVLASQNNRHESGWACKSIINVTGGTFKGGFDCWGMGPGQEADDAQINISGGNFNANPERFLATDYKAVEADGIWNVVVDPVAKVGDAEFETLEEAAAAAEAGETITVLRDATLSAELTLPANVTLNGNGKQINGTIYAGGNLTFAGHTKVTSFSASYYDRVITIGEGACLEITGTGRVTLGYGNTFDITGNVENAKTADKTKVQPSLIIPGGMSITGGSDATMNVTNAYVQIGSTTSKDSAANGVFTLNFTNSIAEFTNQLTFAVPTNGKTPTFNLNVTNSVLTTGPKLIAAAPNSNVRLDNSIVTIATYFRNSGKFEVVNGSVLTGSTIQFGENGGNDGELIVDASVVTINASSKGHALDGKGTGKITLANGAEATVTYYKGITVEVDETSTFTGTEDK